MEVLIPITPFTLKFIAVLNGGVEPRMGATETWFLYKGEATPAEIIDPSDPRTDRVTNWESAAILLFNLR